MMLRNLHALREYRRPPLPSVSIGQAGQVNVAAVQANRAAPVPDPTEQGATDA